MLYSEIALQIPIDTSKAYRVELDILPEDGMYVKDKKKIKSFMQKMTFNKTINKFIDAELGYLHRLRKTNSAMKEAQFRNDIVLKSRYSQNSKQI